MLTFNWSVFWSALAAIVVAGIAKRGVMWIVNMFATPLPPICRYSPENRQTGRN